MAQASFAHAAEALRQGDRERYLTTLVLTGAQRDAVTALYAFNADVASIRERVSDPAPGEIRLQWWNDALEGEGHGMVQQNPVADALLETIARYNIPPGTLLRLIGARRFDLYDDPMPDLQSFEGYAGETVSTLYQLAAMVLNDGEQIEAGDAAGHLGVAHALIGHLRAFGYVAAQGRIMLPWSVFEANGVREGEIFARTESEGLHEAIGQLAELAGEHLRKAESAIALLPAKLKPAFAAIALLKPQLAALNRRANSFAPASDEADWRKITRLMWWGISRGR
ncbi:MAG: phytoene/squalene synthase family protein [Candidatus Devosia phytovorans]|uniref:Phytoene/squalene synthase family protein n=1 Tax=Candidatus Devosia phytovorans TaxID=3121372 RepID=A0AAJ6B3D9_9HYPH|nr:phytoene/squalene synthase family protein [Devosia sp.]WEK06323.1 MAG: phytoene/squalene synthase family protein [Devosia sp.]